MEIQQVISDQTLAKIKSFILYDAGYVPVYTDLAADTSAVDASIFDALIEALRHKAVVGDTTIIVEGGHLKTSVQADFTSLLYSLEQLTSIALSEKENNHE